MMHSIAYTWHFTGVLFAAACFAGFFGALLGVGGGIIIVPAMVLLSHLPIKIAVAASLVSVIATSNAGGSAYVEQHITNLRLGMFLEIATTIGALSGSVLALYLQAWVMLLIFAALLAYMGFASFATRSTDTHRIAADSFRLAKPDRLAEYLSLRGVYHDEHVNKNVEYVVTGTPGGLGISYLAGITSGLLGVGGGVLKVSAMNQTMNVPMKVAVGTSKLMIGVTAAVGAILFFLAGLVHFLIVAPVAIGTTLGATYGTMVMNRLPSTLLKWLFAVLMAYLTYSMVAKGLALHFGAHWPQLG